MRVFIANRKLPCLQGVDDRLINRNEIEIPQTAGEFEAMTFRQGERRSFGKTAGKPLTKVGKKCGNSPGELVKIFALDALQADLLARPNEVGARPIGQRFEVPENIAA